MSMGVVILVGILIGKQTMLGILLVCNHREGRGLRSSYCLNPLETLISLHDVSRGPSVISCELGEQLSVLPHHQRMFVVGGVDVCWFVARRLAFILRFDHSQESSQLFEKDR